MTAPKLTIRKYEIDEVAMRVLEAFDKSKAANGTVQYALGTARATNSGTAFRVTLNLLFASHESKNVPYEIHLVVTGYFSSNIWLPEEGLPASLVTNAATILYGIARGIIGQLSATAQYGVFVLPTLLFANSVAESVGDADSGIVSDETYQRLFKAHTGAISGAPAAKKTSSAPRPRKAKPRAKKQ